MTPQPLPVDADGDRFPLAHVTGSTVAGATDPIVEFFGDPAGVRILDGAVELGIAPPYAAEYEHLGEKLVVVDLTIADVEVTATIVFGAEGGREAGILLRATGGAAGLDTHDGYYAGLFFDEQRVVIGRIHDSVWHELAQIRPRSGFGRSVRMTFSAVGAQLLVRLDGHAVLATRDAAITEGSVAVRTVATRVLFSQIEVSAAT